MKKLSGLAAAVVMAVLSVSAQADTGNPSAQLIVKGTITPGGCSVSLGAGGVVDYGVIRAAELSQTTFNPREERTTSLSVNCGTTPMRFGLTVTDLQAGSKVPGILGVGFTEAQNYGLGASGGRRTGGYSVTLRNLTAIGVTLNPITRTSASGAWQSSDGKVAQAPSQYSWRNGSTITPASITQLTGVIAVKAVINKAQDLDLSRSVDLDGRATLVLNYI